MPLKQPLGVVVLAVVWVIGFVVGGYIGWGLAEWSGAWRSYPPDQATPIH